MSELNVFAAAKAGDLNAVTQILEDDASLIESRDDAGATPIHYAALNGHRDLVRFLVNRGADANSLDAEFGATPAGWAIEYLRELGGVLAIEIDDLVFAIEQRDSKWVKRLLSRMPALKDQRDSDGITIREHAEKTGDQEIVAFFAEETDG